MFYCFLILCGVLAAAGGSTPCQQKDVPKDVLSTFNNSVANLETGRLQVSSLNPNTRYNQFNVTLSQAISNYRLSVSIENIHSFSPKNGLDFKISVVPYPTMFVGYVVMDVQATWSSVSISYAASARTDFIVGSFIVENNKLIDPSFNDSQISIAHTVPISENLSRNHYFAMPFINGLRTEDESLAIAFNRSTFNSTSRILTLTLKIHYQTYPLEFLSVSYLIFHMAAELQISRLSNINSIPSTIDTFLGVSTVAISPALFQKAAANSNRPLLSSAPATIEAFSGMFGVDGIMVQTQRSLDLLFLPVTNISTTLTCISKATCSEYHGEMVYEQIGVYDVESKCQICMQYSTVNQKSGLCECVQGYTQVNGTCVPLSESCKANQVFSQKEQQCVCAQLYVNISGICINIMSLCGPNQIYYLGKCYQVSFNSNASPCPLGYLMVNNLCVKKQVCSQGQLLDEKTNKCSCPAGTGLLNGLCQKCGQNETAVSGICQCNDRYYRIGGVCKMCGRYAFFNGQTCVCSRNYQGDGFTCTASSNLQAELASPLSGAFIPGGAITISNKV